MFVFSPCESWQSLLTWISRWSLNVTVLFLFSCVGLRRLSSLLLHVPDFSLNLWRFCVHTWFWVAWNCCWLRNFCEMFSNAYVLVFSVVARNVQNSRQFGVASSPSQQLVDARLESKWYVCVSAKGFVRWYLLMHNLWCAVFCWNWIFDDLRDDSDLLPDLATDDDSYVVNTIYDAYVNTWLVQPFVLPWFQCFSPPAFHFSFVRR